MAPLVRPRRSLGGRRYHASNAAVRVPRSPDDQRRSTPVSSPVTTTIRTARIDDAEECVIRPVEAAISLTDNHVSDCIRNVIGLALHRQRCDSPRSPSAVISVIVYFQRKPGVSSAVWTAGLTLGTRGVSRQICQPVFGLLTPEDRPRSTWGSSSIPTMVVTACDRRSLWPLQLVLTACFARPVHSRVRPLSISCRMCRSTARIRASVRPGLFRLAGLRFGSRKCSHASWSRAKMGWPAPPTATATVRTTPRRSLQ